MSTMIGRPRHQKSVEQIRQNAVERLRSVMRILRYKASAVNELDTLQKLLESLPMASGEFSTAMNRLRNSQRYLCSEEIGAALYELRLLTSLLQPPRRWY
jgi:hypothetical protein